MLVILLAWVFWLALHGRLNDYAGYVTTGPGVFGAGSNNGPVPPNRDPITGKPIQSRPAASGLPGTPSSSSSGTGAANPAWWSKFSQWWQSLPPVFKPQ